MHQLCTFHCRLRAAVNPLRPGPQRCADLTPLRIVQTMTRRWKFFVDVMFFTKFNRILLKFLQQDKRYSVRQLF